MTLRGLPVGVNAATVDPQPSDFRDARPCAAYVGRDVMEAIGASVGDVVRMTTIRGRTALARIVGEHPGMGAGRHVRFDRFTRQALKVYPHEQVAVERADLGPATEVTLVPAVDISMLHLPNLVPQLKACLAEAQCPVREGMLLYVRLSDAGAGITYDVHAVREGEGIITSGTALYLEFEHDHEHGANSHEHGEGQRAARAETVVDTTFEDVGGLTAQIRAIREFVELPLVFPQVYRQLGITPPRGVIFFGAPGTGKTLLARSVANEIHAEFFSINGPEIVGTFSGQTEENLRRIFGEAAFKTPSIIFVDELDAIAPARRTATTLSDSRAVTQLLSLMDGLKRAEGVMVIGTTNRIEAIDPALRRAGRFDREIYFPSPDIRGREEILRVHTREMPLADDAIAALPEVARRAYGFVGADLMELAREAGLAALRRSASAFIDQPGQIGQLAASPSAIPSVGDLVVTADDLFGALRQMRPASLRESILSYPSVTLADVGGLWDAKRRVCELIQRPLEHPDHFTRLGLSTSVGLLLHGPPGTGKTLLANAIARETGANLISIQGPELFSQWFGESEEAVRDLFNLARRAAPCIVFFDQLDAVAPRRSDLENEGTRAPQRIVNQLLTELDAIDRSSQVIVMGATNRVEMVDPAVLRPGRFGVHLLLDLPTESERAEILRIQLRDALLDPAVDASALADEIAARTSGLSGADLAALCQAAKLHALDAAGYAGEPRLTRADFAAAIPTRDARP
ncbi:MAG TPA: AAA family ATPase [Chloroflexota bacterium]|nr:AAA family ATPase [Chloroflexota bacterium]